MPESTADSTELILKELLRQPGVDGVIEFGSTGRGESTTGDLDVLVVLRDISGKHEMVTWADSKSRVTGVNISPTVMTRESLAERIRKSPSFGVHLQKEGRIDGNGEVITEIRKLLDAVQVTPDSLQREFLELQQRLERIATPSRLAGHYLTALGRIYAIGRAASILQLVAAGTPEYDWRTTFKTLSEMRPELQGAIAVVVSLRPFYEALDGRRGVGQLTSGATRRRYEESVDAARKIVQPQEHRLAG